MKFKSVTRWFVMGADGSLVDGPYKYKGGAKKAMIEQPDYLRYPGWYGLEQKSYRIPTGNVGGMRAKGRSHRSGWQREADGIKHEWMEAGCPTTR